MSCVVLRCFLTPLSGCLKHSCRVWCSGGPVESQGLNCRPPGEPSLSKTKVSRGLPAHCFPGAGGTLTLLPRSHNQGLETAFCVWPRGTSGALGVRVWQQGLWADPACNPCTGKPFLKGKLGVSSLRAQSVLSAALKAPCLRFPVPPPALLSLASLFSLRPELSGLREGGLCQRQGTGWTGDSVTALCCCSQQREWGGGQCGFLLGSLV